MSERSGNKIVSHSIPEYKQDISDRKITKLTLMTISGYLGILLRIFKRFLYQAKLLLFGTFPVNVSVKFKILLLENY